MKKFKSTVLGLVLLVLPLTSEATPRGGNFLWGASFSAHQTEGGDFNSDWWEWENIPGKIARGENSSVATDHYRRFREDFALAETLGLQVVRFSVSWARIEPKPGVFDTAELAHYREVVLDLRARGLIPVICLQHFVHPKWFAERGGWLAPDAPEHFAKFTQAVADALGDQVSLWITFNEPMVQLVAGFLKGEMPPAHSDFQFAIRAFQNILRAHALATGILRKTPGLRKPNGLAVQGVSAAFNVHAFMPARSAKTNEGQQDLEAIQTLSHLYQYAILEAMQTGVLEWKIPPIGMLPHGHSLHLEIPELKNSLDWVGLNYYSAWMIQKDPSNSMGIQWLVPPGGNVQPQGLLQVIEETNARLKKPLPLIISENGLADSTDAYRKDFVDSHLKYVDQALRQGFDVRGYWYWSLTDNFEWNQGYAPRYGLIEIDYSNLSRKVRPSALWFRDYIRNHPMGRKKLGLGKN